MFDGPIGYFLTWTTYGTWLPGDSRGWVEYRHGWQLPAPIRELEAAARMTERACRLDARQREAVEEQIRETCAHRGWRLEAVNCRSNHIHVVATGVNAKPKKLRADLKAWATRRLKDQFDDSRENWWTERGSVRYVFDAIALEAAILYTTEAQDRKQNKHRDA